MAKYSDMTMAQLDALLPSLTDEEVTEALMETYGDRSVDIADDRKRGLTDRQILQDFLDWGI